MEETSEFEKLPRAHRAPAREGFLGVVSTALKGGLKRGLKGGLKGGLQGGLKGPLSACTLLGQSVRLPRLGSPRVVRFQHRPEPATWEFPKK